MEASAARVLNSAYLDRCFISGRLGSLDLSDDMQSVLVLMHKYSCIVLFISDIKWSEMCA